MARIRSIKPDFFSSEVIASLPLSARLTFIGLWTHVDDNGVCVDNERLITFAVWPNEPDVLESLRMVRGDLRRLHEVGLIQRYARDGKQYMFVRSWDEHQKVSHPAKARYPRPDEAGCVLLTCEDFDDLDSLPTASGNSPELFGESLETLRPEQGAGSREQGENPPASAPPLLDPPALDQPDDFPSTAPKRAWSAAQIDADPKWIAFWNAYPLKRDKGHARKTWLKVLRAGVDPDMIAAAAASYRDDPKRKPDYTAHAATWLNGERWEDHQQAEQSLAYAAPRPWWEN